MANQAPNFAPPSADLGAVSSVVQAPTGATLPLSKLAPEAALRRLELTVVRRLDGFLHGDHQGLLPGAGSETNDAREYVPGQDDVRKIDWAVTARTQVPHVRDTIADRELEIWALLDVTPSMNWVPPASPSETWGSPRWPPSASSASAWGIASAVW